jgi:hypothetical protein
MASLLKTLNFVIAFFLATSKTQVLVTIATLSIYLFNFNDLYKIVFSVNSLILNLLIAYSLFNKDEYIRLTGFYKFLNISNTSVLISKSIILFGLLSIHQSLLLLLALKMSLKVCCIINIILLLAFINNIVSNNITRKIISFTLLILLLYILFLTFSVANILLFVILLLVISLLFLFRVYHLHIKSFM